MTSELAAGPVRSRYTLAERTAEGDGILCNTFTGAIDLVDGDLADLVQKGSDAALPGELIDFLLDRGYFVEDRALEDAVARRYAVLKKQKSRERAQPKYMFALTLRCNLSCSYCWQVQEQRKERQSTGTMDAERVDAAFRYIAEDLKLQRRSDAFISLFGGEPLLDTAHHHTLVDLIGERCLANSYHLHFTTNGRQLAAFTTEVERFRPSIQVTVDGFRRRTDGRLALMRADQELPNLYDTLVSFAADYGIQIFLRFLATTASCDEFIDLGDRLYGDAASTIQLAVAPIQNKSRMRLDGVSEKYVVLERLIDKLNGRAYASRISYVDWRSLNILANLRNGVDTMPDAVFHHCEANVNLTCFDYDGRIFACYEGIGNSSYAVGTYHPEVSIDRAHLARYRDRDAFTMEQCSTCANSPICGGGCEVRAEKKTGSYDNPFCDGLHSEMAQVLRNWRTVYSTLAGDHDNGA